VGFTKSPECSEVKKFALRCLEHHYHSVRDYSRDTLDDLLNEELEDWCKNRSEAFLNNKEAYNSSSCCNQYPFIDQPLPIVLKCKSICEAQDEAVEPCELKCLYKELKVDLNGTYNKQAVKREFLNSMLNNTELMKKYDPIVDESISKCETFSKFVSKESPLNNTIFTDPVADFKDYFKRIATIVLCAEALNFLNCVNYNSNKQECAEIKDFGLKCIDQHLTFVINYLLGIDEEALPLLKN